MSEDPGKPKKAIGVCACGKLAFAIKNNCYVCPDCLALEHQSHQAKAGVRKTVTALRYAESNDAQKLLR
jgi:hypothetical protein